MDDDNNDDNDDNNGTKWRKMEWWSFLLCRFEFGVCNYEMVDWNLIRWIVWNYRWDLQVCHRSWNWNWILDIARWIWK